MEAGKAAQMLKYADQNILEIRMLTRNGYGAVMSADVRYSCKYPINDAVLAAKQVTRVVIDGLWGGDSFSRISQQIQLLKNADFIILNVYPTSHNGYGKICSAEIWSISRTKYETIMGK